MIVFICIVYIVMASALIYALFFLVPEWRAAMKMKMDFDPHLHDLEILFDKEDRIQSQLTTFLNALSLTSTNDSKIQNFVDALNACKLERNRLKAKLRKK